MVLILRCCTSFACDADVRREEKRREEEEGVGSGESTSNRLTRLNEDEGLLIVLSKTVN